MTYTQFAANWKRKMNEAFQIANQNSDKGKQYHKAVYDKKARSVDLKVGDRVLVQNCKPLGTGKLSSFWQPNVFVVLKKRDNLPVYELRRYGSPKDKVRVLHRNLLKPVNDLLPQEVDTPVVAQKSTTNSEKIQSTPDVRKNVTSSSENNATGSLKPKGKRGKKKSVSLNPKVMVKKFQATDDVPDILFESEEADALPGEVSTHQDDSDSDSDDYAVIVSWSPDVNKKTDLPGNAEAENVDQEQVVVGSPQPTENRVEEPGFSGFRDEVEEIALNDHAGELNTESDDLDEEESPDLDEEESPERVAIDYDSDSDDLDVADVVENRNVSSDESTLDATVEPENDETISELEPENETISELEHELEIDTESETDGITDTDITDAESSGTVYESAYERVSDFEYEPESPDSSFNSGSSSPPPNRPEITRRSARNIKPPSVLTYDKPGVPLIYQPPTRPKK